MDFPTRLGFIELCFSENHIALIKGAPYAPATEHSSHLAIGDCQQ